MTAASASGMVKRLGELGLVSHEPYHGVSLTEAGPQRRARGDAPPPAARAVPGAEPRRAVGPSPRGGRGARARPLGGARGADRGEARRPDARSRTAIRSRRASCRSRSVETRRACESLNGGDERHVHAGLGFGSGDAALSRRQGIAPGDELEVVETQPFDGPLFVRFGDQVHVLGGRARAGDARRGARMTPPPIPTAGSAASGAVRCRRSILSPEDCCPVARSLPRPRRSPEAPAVVPVLVARRSRDPRDARGERRSEHDLVCNERRDLRPRLLPAVHRRDVRDGDSSPRRWRCASERSPIVDTVSWCCERFGPLWGWFSAGDLILTNLVTLIAEFVAIRIGLAYFHVGAGVAASLGIAARGVHAQRAVATGAGSGSSSASRSSTACSCWRPI